VCVCVCVCVCVTHCGWVGVQEEHCYTLREHGEELFKFAAARGATVLVHSGDRHSAPMDFLPFADAHPQVWSFKLTVSAAHSSLHTNHIPCYWSARSSIQWPKSYSVQLLQRKAHANGHRFAMSMRRILLRGPPPTSRSRGHI
jgi:hypothetical protein